MMNDASLHTMNLRSKVISLEKTVDSYRSSKKYTDLHDFYSRQLKEKDKKFDTLTQERAKDSFQHKKEIREWRKAMVEMSNDYEKKLASKDKVIETLNGVINKQYKEAAETYEHEIERKAKIQNLENQLDDEKGKNAKLTAQKNKDYENSGKPSSATPFHKKIENGREPSDKNPGGQKGHQGHRRKKYKPTNIITIDPPIEYLDTTKYIPTGKMIKKQVVHVSLVIQADEYQTPEFRRITNRHRVHADFPKGVDNEVNFGSSVQALAFLLNQHYNVSIAKTRDFLHEVSGGVFSISTGCINQLCKKFSEKTKKQQGEIFDQLVNAEVLNSDFTTARVNGKLMQVLICATKGPMMYYAREHKGHKGLKDSPVEYTTNTIVHDHEIAFYTYGGNHQECLVHVLRYLKGSMENESHLSWNKRMYDTIHKMIHYIKSTDNRDERKIEALIKEYDRNLEIAELNYKEHPPTKYYREGFNLAKRMKEYRDYHLLFLTMEEVPYENNLSERFARVFKRKMKQMTSFRSFDSFAYTCSSLGMIETMRAQGGNLLEKVVEVFDM